MATELRQRRLASLKALYEALKDRQDADPDALLRLESDVEHEFQLLEPGLDEQAACRHRRGGCLDGAAGPQRPWAGGAARGGTRLPRRKQRLDVQPDLFGAWCVLADSGDCERSIRSIVNTKSGDHEHLLAWARSGLSEWTPNDGELPPPTVVRSHFRWLVVKHSRFLVRLGGPFSRPGLNIARASHAARSSKAAPWPPA